MKRPPATGSPALGASRPAYGTASGAGGFTLIEVLVALAIVSVGMAALLGALSSSADSAAYLRDKTFAEWVALNHLAEVRVALKRPTKGKTDGEEELAGRKWKWSQEVLETEVKGILRIDVSVRPSDAPGNKDTTWYTTVSGIIGDALALPRGDMDAFGAAMDTGPGGTGAPGTGLPGTQQPGTQLPGTQPPGTQPPGTSNNGLNNSGSISPLPPSQTPNPRD